MIPHPLRPHPTSRLPPLHAHGPRHPFDRPVSNPQIGLPILTGFSGLPRDGALLATVDELCDPYESLCKTAAFVSEAPCFPCRGTGLRKAARGRRAQTHPVLFTCPSCLGLGRVRLASEDPPGNVEERMAGTVGRDRTEYKIPPQRYAWMKAKAELGRKMLEEELEALEGKS